MSDMRQTPGDTSRKKYFRERPILSVLSRSENEAISPNRTLAQCHILSEFKPLRKLATSSPCGLPLTFNLCRSNIVRRLYNEEARCLSRIGARMNEFIPEANQTVSPEVLADLKMLVREHEMSAGLIQSLMVSKEQARVHLKFLKTKMYLTNGVVMFLGMVLAGFGIQRLMYGFSVIAIIGFIVGAFLFVKFSAVFIATQRALRATEAVARKHNLI